MRGLWMALTLAALLCGVMFCMALAAAAPSPALAQMIRGLEALPRVTQREAAAFPPARGTPLLTLQGERLPYDAATNTYFIPQSADTAAFEGAVALARREGYAYYLYHGAPDKQTALETSAVYTLYGVSGEACESANVVFTALPVMCLATRTGALPTEEDGAGTLRVFSLENGALSCQSSEMEINLRGNNSKRLPKKSYRLKLVDGRGEKRDLSIAGLRADDDWILNPLYADTSKIREKLAYELWETINSSGRRASSSRLVHVEVLFNGGYFGLYGLQERVDNKQVGGDKRTDILYKVKTNDRPTAEELLACQSRDACRAFEAKNGGAFGGDTQTLWTPAAAYISALSGEPLAANCAVSLANAVDYGLWAMLTQAHDCHFKNQFLNCVFENDGYTLYKIPWDLNNTFGDVWRGGGADTNYTDYKIGELVMDGLFARMVESGEERLLAAIRARWAALRAGTVTREAILARARELYAALAGALKRDSARWPQCGMGEGNALNIGDIEQFMDSVLPRMDAFIDALGAPP